MCFLAALGCFTLPPRTRDAAATSCHALIPRSPAVGVRLRVRLFGALGRVRDVSGFPSEPFVQTQLFSRLSAKPRRPIRDSG